MREGIHPGVSSVGPSPLAALKVVREDRLGRGVELFHHKEAKRLGVPRQSIIKVWVAERLKEEKKKA